MADPAGGSPRILVVAALGGMGKSALTWKWFDEVAPLEMQPLAGRMWWSFYESDATFENFVMRALAYVTRRPRPEVERTPAPEREVELLAVLDRQPFLVALDGLERILIAYARMDAARLRDGEVGEQRHLRKTADPRAGRFLQKLARVRASRVLVSTRLYPAEMENAAGEPLPGCFRLDIHGLSDADAVELWRAFGVSGARDELLPLFAAFDNHPLLVQALAGEVKSYRRAPGDLAAWRAAHPHFDPAGCPRLQEAMAHVLEYALRGLDGRARQALHTLAAFRMPARYDTLAALLVAGGRGGSETRPYGDGSRPDAAERDADLAGPAVDGRRSSVLPRPYADERELDAALTELEERGLLGWDRRANRYDLHPIVRGVAWGGLGDADRRGVYVVLRAHFEALPAIDEDDVNTLEDLTPAIELYNTLVGLGRYGDAFVVFRDRLEKATLYRLSASRQRAEMLELLFPDGLEQPPRLSKSAQQAFTLNALAQGYLFSGQPGRAAPLYRRQIAIREKEGSLKNVSIGLRNLSNALQRAGELRQAEAAARRALAITREQENRSDEAHSLFSLGTAMAARGIEPDSATALNRAVRIARQADAYEPYDYQAQRALWLGHFHDAGDWADKALKYCEWQRYERGMIRAARLQGAAALGLGDFIRADDRLHRALTRARAVNLVEEELPALVALAELRRRQGEPDAACELLEDVWEPAERGPYPLFHADACNVLAQLERDAGDPAAAVAAATRAYRLAWCDGPPFAYHWGLLAARRHLHDLGAPEPALLPFDESRYEPMPEVEIDPQDEFHAGEGGE